MLNFTLQVKLVCNRKRLKTLKRPTKLRIKAEKLQKIK